MKLMILGILLFTTGCAVHNTSFSCKTKAGQQCVSVSKVNKMVDSGLIVDEQERSKPKKFKSKKVKKKRGLDIWVRQDEKFI